LVQNLDEFIKSKNKSNINVIFGHRLNIIEGIAQGLSWFHKAKPPIVHHDLKPSNILLDKDDNPKICDFGLSHFIFDESIRSSAGSKLWSAPEVLQDEDHNEKVDVFSFAIMTWQLFVMEDLPYKDYVEREDLDAFIYDVSFKNVRPPLDGVTEAAHELLTSMWHHNPKKRPDMNTVLIEMNTIKIDYHLRDKESIKFWNHISPDSSPITFSDFIKELLIFLKNKDLEVPDYEVLKLLLANKDYKVTIESFSKVINWFGPLKTDFDNIINRMLYVCQFEWFVGDIGRNEAETTLKSFNTNDSSKGIFPYIVRLSLPEEKDISVHPATISYYSLEERKKKKNLVIDHLKIEKNNDLYVIERFTRNGESFQFENISLYGIVQEVEQSLGLTPMTGIDQKYITAKINGGQLTKPQYVGDKSMIGDSN